MIQLYDFRIDADGKPQQPTLPGAYPGLWFLLAADRFTGAVPGIAHHVFHFVNEHLRFRDPATPGFGTPPPESPATHRMYCCDLELVAEPFQRQAAQEFISELRKHTQAKCLIIGGAWPGHGGHRVWNHQKIMEELRGEALDMDILLNEQLPLYKAAGVLTYNISADKPSDLNVALEKAILMGDFLGLYASGLERCLWLSGHYGPGGNNAEWTPEECAYFVDGVWEHWDSFALHHGVPAQTNLGNEIARRLA
jgi:hypothetical protein